MLSEAGMLEIADGVVRLVRASKSSSRDTGLCVLPLVAGASHRDAEPATGTSDVHGSLVMTEI